MDYNQATLMGHLSKNPETRELSGGNKVTKIRLATGRNYKREDGTTGQTTQFHTLAFWRKKSDLIERLAVKKGDRLFVTGEITYNEYNEKTYTEINVDEFIVLRDKGASQGGASGKDIDGPGFFQ